MTMLTLATMAMAFRYPPHALTFAGRAHIQMCHDADMLKGAPDVSIAADDLSGLLGEQAKAEDESTIEAKLDVLSASPFAGLEEEEQTSSVYMMERDTLVGQACPQKTSHSAITARYRPP
jgi:hypothetical protein